MRLNTHVRQTGWLLLAVVALLGTWSQILDYLELSFLDAQRQFWRDTLLHPASRFATIDLIFVCIAASAWMLAEARRLRIGMVWGYVVFGCLVAFSAALPLFMFARERALARRWEDERSLATGDQLGLLLLVAFGLGYLWMATRAAFPG
ncbi:MAG: DUF2834 domain-containing protein [Proteobacteria bacterium]|nr:DUF2834 domain-containing protein [Pseudomonadota bacterium]